MPTSENSGGASISTERGQFKIAIVAHFFYEAQARLIIELLKKLPLDFDLYVSAPSEKEAFVKALLADASDRRKSVFEKVLNRGFDIAPFICSFGGFYAAYDLVIKIHTKQTRHVPWLKGWGEYLLLNTVGSPKVVGDILKMFAADERLGIVYPEVVPPLKQELDEDAWQENWEHCRDLSSRLGLSISKETQAVFPAGSMFWFRPKALKSLFRLGIVPDDFPEGRRILRNGTLAHAVERLLVLIAEKEGFCTRTICFEPFKTIRAGSLWDRMKNKAHSEWNRILDFVGVNR